MQLSTFRFWTTRCFVLLLTLSPCHLVSLSSARAESPVAEDEQALRSAGLSADGASLLAAIRKHTLTTETRKKVDGLIPRLGADDFAEREKASKQLFALGRVSLPQLREASKHNDPEIARRARSLIERIEREPAHHLPAVAFRLLAVRKPPGVVEALLAYLPHAEDEGLAEGVQKALAVLARREGKLEPALRRALEDSRQAPAVRMRVALALASAGEREAVPVLIDLLAVLPVEQVGWAEEALYQLASDSAPKTPEDTEAAERKMCRDAWAAWWKANAKHADLNRLRLQPLLGYTLICDNLNGRVYEIDRQGKQRWAIDNLSNPLDAIVLPGNRVLIAESNADCVSERDFKGNIRWQKAIRDPVSVQRLPNGNTFIATYKGRILEVDRAGNELYAIDNGPDTIMAAYRWHKGVIVYQTLKGECVLVDTTGKRLRRFATKQVLQYANAIDLSPDGHILVAQDQRNKVIEYDNKGTMLLELRAPGVTTATRSPDGHILVASKTTQRVYELDQAGKVIWEHRCASQVFRARRR